MKLTCGPAPAVSNRRSVSFVASVATDGDCKSPAQSTAEKWRKSGKWIVFNALAGPTLGVSCYQWALKTTPSAVVLPIVALSPLVVMPFSRWLEQERPSKRSTLGAVIAVAGAVGLALVK